MRSILFLAAALIISLNAAAQAPKYTGQAEVGIIIRGEMPDSQTGITLQSFNGVRIKNFEAGISAGADIYSEFKVIPLSLGLRAVLPLKGIAPYIAADAGYGLTWLEKRTEATWYRGGLMLNPAAGIRVLSKNPPYVSFSVGYKYQQVSRFEGELSSTPMPPVPGIPPGYISVQEERYRLNRVLIKIGITY